jgi:DNA-binding transcriptional LysR family regulator
VEVRLARYFIAVAEELHFGRAAHRLHMSQPPLSQAIQALERDLGVQLLHRTSRQVSLTKAGEVLLQHCRQLVRDADRARAAVQRTREGYSGELIIGAVASAFTDILPAALGRYRTLRPDVRLRLIEVDTEAGARAVQDREIDIALVRRSTGGPGCRAVPLRHDQFVAVLPNDHPRAKDAAGQEKQARGRNGAAEGTRGREAGAEETRARGREAGAEETPARGREAGAEGEDPPGRKGAAGGNDARPEKGGVEEPLDLGELATEPWVWIPRDIAPGYHDEVVAACRQAGFSPDARHQANSIATQLAMVSCGIGVAIAPSLVAEGRRDVATRKLRQPAEMVALSVLVQEDIDPLVEHFVKAMSTAGG